MDSKTETVSDNELIAQFMGLPKNGIWYTVSFIHAVTADELKYHKLWDHLMPVVEKISQIYDSKFKYDLSKVKRGHWPVDNEYMDVIALPLATPINKVHKAVVEFIKYFNSQSPETDKK